MQTATPNACRFIRMLVEDRGFTQAEAETIRKVYRAEKILKIDIHAGGFTVVHGAFLEDAVLRRTVELSK